MLITTNHFAMQHRLMDLWNCWRSNAANRLTQGVHPAASTAVCARFHKFIFVAASVFIVIHSSQPATAACKIAMSDSRLNSFILDPLPILLLYPTGGNELANQIRAFASSNHSAMLAIKRLSVRASLNQKRAIGQGMAIAAVACLARDAEIAKEIADVVQTMADIDVTQSFLKYTTDDPPRVKSADTDTAAQPIKRNSLGYDKNIPLPSTAVPPIPLSDTGKVP